MKKITQKQIRKQLIDIVKKYEIEEVTCESRYVEGFLGEQHRIGSIITIRTKE